MKNDTNNSNLKRKYTAPKTEVTLLYLENCIASGSAEIRFRGAESNELEHIWKEETLTEIAEW